MSKPSGVVPAWRTPHVFDQSVAHPSTAFPGVEGLGFPRLRAGLGTRHCGGRQQRPGAIKRTTVCQPFAIQWPTCTAPGYAKRTKAAGPPPTGWLPLRAPPAPLHPSPLPEPSAVRDAGAQFRRSGHGKSAGLVFKELQLPVQWLRR
jgi:hypothetical protein